MPKHVNLKSCFVFFTFLIINYTFANKKIWKFTLYKLNISIFYKKAKEVQWNLDLTKSLGTGQICSLNGGFVISNTSMLRIRGETTKIFVISRS